MLPGIFFIYLFSRTYHITLRRRAGTVTARLSTKILGLFVIKTENINNITGAMLEEWPGDSDSGRQSYRVVLETDSGLVPVNKIYTNTGWPQGSVEKINDLVSGRNRLDVSLSLNKLIAFATFMGFGVSFFWLAWSLYSEQIESLGRHRVVDALITSERGVASLEGMRLRELPLQPVGVSLPEFCEYHYASENTKGGWRMHGVTERMPRQAINMVFAQMDLSVWKVDHSGEYGNTRVMKFRNNDMKVLYAFTHAVGSKTTCSIEWGKQL